MYIPGCQEVNVLIVLYSPIDVHVVFSASFASMHPPLSFSLHLPSLFNPNWSDCWYSGVRVSSRFLPVKRNFFLQLSPVIRVCSCRTVLGSNELAWIWAGLHVKCHEITFFYDLEVYKLIVIDRLTDWLSDWLKNNNVQKA